MVSFGMLLFFTLLSGFLGLYSTFAIEQRDLKRRLVDVEKDYPVNHVELEKRQSLLGKMAHGLSEKLLAIASIFNTRNQLDRLENKLYRAGLMPKINVSGWLLIRVLIQFLLPLLMGVLLALVTEDIPRAILSALSMSVSAYSSSMLYLNNRIKQRRKALESALPDALDLITVSVEAGLSFDGAMDRVALNMQGPLAQEFGQTLKALRMGKSRREAMRDMSDRCDTSDLTTFIGSIIQADELGVSIGSILRIQSVQMRERRRQRAREKSMQAPIKMMFPLALFIFPTIFVVLLGPAMIQMMETFMK